MSIRRTDPRFLLPRPAGRAVVLGGLDEWREGLQEAGVAMWSRDDAEPPDLAVAPARLASAAVATGAGMLVLEGGTGGVSLPARFHVARLLPRPALERPSLLLPLDDPVAARYAVEQWSVVDTRWRRARRAAARELVGRRAFPRIGPRVTVASGGGGVPYVVAGAEGVGLPRPAGWVLTLGQADALSRNVFHLFAAGSDRPSWVVKFARVPGYVEPFARDEYGLRLAERAGGAVAAHAPTLLGRFEAGGVAAAAETAAVGHRLRERLQEPGSRREKRRLIDAVAAWVVELAVQTRSIPEELSDERRRLEREVVPRWREAGAGPTLVERLPPLPGVLQHNDLGSWNVVVDDRRGFTALDWESARERGLPLWDLFYFLADALAMLDGSWSGEERHLHTVRLFRGEAPSSPVLFGWTRRLVSALDLPAEAVGAVATLCWLHHSLSHHARRAALGRFARSGAAARVHGTERVARLWLADPLLGPGWDRWRR